MPFAGLPPGNGLFFLFLSVIAGGYVGGTGLPVVVVN
jgi:hypothetical protein